MIFDSSFWYLANTLTTRRWEYCAITCGSLSATFLLIALAISGNIPPTKPWWDAQQVHTHYWGHVKGTQASSIFLMVAGAFYVIYGAAITRQLRRIPDIDPIIPDLQLASAAAGFCPFMLSAIALSLLTFRDYGPELTQLLNDIFWMSFFFPWPIFWVQMWTISWAILSDKSPIPVLPRSIAMVNFAAPIVFALGTGIHMHHTGPLAWNGGLVFWPTLVIFGVQVGGDCWYMLGNLQKRQTLV
jgi:hypothetical protein